MTCRDCIHLEVPRRPPEDHRVYTCLVEPPEPALPACMTEAYRFTWPPARTYMRPTSGDGCPYYQPLQ